MQEEQDCYLQLTLQAVKKEGLILNQAKCIYLKPEIPLLGYIVGNKLIKPNPERVLELLDIPCKQHLHYFYIEEH